MLEVILCELEGVLADTAPLRRAALQASLAEEGLALGDDEFDAVCAALPVASAVAAALGLRASPRDALGVELIAARAERHFLARASGGILLAPGAREFVERAQARVRLGLVTRASRRVAELLLSLASLETAFEHVIAAEDTLEQKPGGAPYRRALERLRRRRGFSPDHAIALEDGLVGLRAARAAELRCALVGEAFAHRRPPRDGRVGSTAAIPSLVGLTLDEIEAHLSLPDVRVA